MGMPYELFWEGRSDLVKAYRKSYQIKTDHDNYYSWLNGLYVLQALRSGVPVMLNGVAKHPQPFEQYPKQPILLSAERQKQEQKKKEKEQMQLQVARMQQIAEQFNRSFLKKQGEKEQ